MGTLRLILALSVVIWHSGPIFGWLPYNGTACVNYFFVISGFYMTLILTRKYVGAGSFALFWSNRFLRLWPSFAFISLLVSILHFGGIFETYGQLEFTSAVLAGGINLTMVGYEFFDLMTVSDAGRLTLDLTPHDGLQARTLVLLSQGWSIGLEIWFYLMAPFVVRSFRASLIWLALGLVLFSVSNLWVLEETWRYRFFPNIMAFFAIGVVSFHLRIHYSQRPVRRLIDAFALWGLLPLTVTFLLYPPLMNLIVHEQHHLKLLLLIALPGVPVWFEASQKVQLDRMLGELSYPVYLNHIVINTIIGAFIPALASAATLRTVCVLAVSLAMAWAMVRFIEQPVDGWRQRRVSASGGRQAMA